MPSVQVVRRHLSQASQIIIIIINIIIIIIIIIIIQLRPSLSVKYYNVIKCCFNAVGCIICSTNSSIVMNMVTDFDCVGV